MKRSVTVIIPVFEAFEEAKRCLLSVVRFTGDARIVVIDDASPCGKFSDFIGNELSQAKNLEIRRVEENLGFVRSCNLGMSLFPEDDIILLNSDTVVTFRWVAKLQEAAYSSPHIGTVTPLTNNGTICSVPRFLVSNDLPDGISVDDMNSVVESVSRKERIVLPTCIGFCVFFKRDMLKRVGLFREDLFGKGYGEENDLSCRSQKAGFLDIVDDQTFVFHEGGRSFREQTSLLQEENLKTLAKLHPGYLPSVTRFCRRNPLRRIQERIQYDLFLRALKDGKPRILHVVHNGPYDPIFHELGGTERVVQQLISGIDSCHHFSLVPSKAEYLCRYHGKGIELTFALKRASESLRALLQPGVFDVIHVHHTRGFPREELCSILREHPHVVTSLHDFVAVCPRFHLLTPQGRVCNLHECERSCGYESKFIEKYRDAHLVLLRKSSPIVAYSRDSQRVLESVSSQNFNLKYCSHGLSFQERLPLRLSCPENEPEVRVALLGTLPEHKGLTLVEQLDAVQALPSGKNLKIKLFGDSPRPTSFEKSGRYDGLSELRELLDEFSPHCALFVSRCPETFSLTLEEALFFGIPVVVSPYGALKERVEEFEVGEVLRELSLAAVVESLDRISKNSTYWQKFRSNACAYQPKPWNEVVRFYGEHYERRSDTKAVSEVFDIVTDDSLRARSGLSKKVRERVSDSLDLFFYALARTGLRAPVEALTRSLIPSSVLEKLRELR